jgi:Uncharacterized protein conserved in bacteria (DUF2188)
MPEPGGRPAVWLLSPTMPRPTANRNVQPNDHIGGWEVVRAGNVRTLAFDGTKAGAVRKARAMVRREGGGEVRVKNHIGKVVEAEKVRGGLRFLRLRPGA